MAAWSSLSGSYTYFTLPIIDAKTVVLKRSFCMAHYCFASIHFLITELWASVLYFSFKFRYDSNGELWIFTLNKERFEIFAVFANAFKLASNAKL
jgi:hypothetical protein